MSSTPIGFTFNETMSGPLAIGESDPDAGRLRGKRDNTELVMHATITIEDLDAFINDEKHLGQIKGELDFSPFGKGLVAPSGVFNLFSPTDDPELKLMVYELGFEHAGKPYYMAGHKKVHDADATKMWKATTTLYTQIHEGTDKDGPVVAAGIISLGVTKLLSLMSTMQVIGTESPLEKAETIAKFGSFFMGDLWDTYMKH